MMRVQGFFLFVISVFPVWANAVSINEIAWMGDSDSANNEWIELYNNADTAIDVSGWMLTDGASLAISLSGTISANSLAVLERTDDDSAPGTAFLIYAGALSNSGATLVLRDATDQIIDQVVGGEDWVNVGGDNVTKETAQYTTGGWITATASPGTANETIVEEEVIETTTETTEDTEIETKTNAATTATNRDKTSSTKLVLPDVALDLTITAQAVVYVHQSFELSVEPSGLGEVIMDSLQYQWNLGDLTTTTGQTIQHRYHYPGEYVVVVEGTYARHGQIARREITVLPVELSLTTNRDGAVQIHNHAKYEVDLSGYRLVGEKVVTLPPHTIVLTNGTITVSEAYVPHAGRVSLFDERAFMVASLNQSTPPVPASPEPLSQNTEITPTSSSQPAKVITTATPTNFSFTQIEDVTATTSGSAEPLIQLATTATSSTVTPETKDTSTNWAWYGLIGLLSLGILAGLVKRGNRYIDK